MAHCHLGLTLYQRVGRREQAQTELAATAAMETPLWLAEAALSHVAG